MDALFYLLGLTRQVSQYLEDNLVGQEATKLFEDAQSMINQIISKKLLKPRAVFGIFEANSVNDDDIKVRLNKETWFYLEHYASNYKKAWEK